MASLLVLLSGCGAYESSTYGGGEVELHFSGEGWSRDMAVPGGVGEVTTLRPSALFGACEEGDETFALLHYRFRPAKVYERRAEWLQLFACVTGDRLDGLIDQEVEDPALTLYVELDDPRASPWTQGRREVLVIATVMDRATGEEWDIGQGDTLERLVFEDPTELSLNAELSWDDGSDSVLMESEWGLVDRVQD